MRRTTAWTNRIAPRLGEGFDDLLASSDSKSALTDQLGTIRDLAVVDADGAATIANHRVFDAYGQLTGETHPEVDCDFRFTGRLFDADSGLQYNHHRWYDPAVGRWLSKDPIGFAAGDANVYRYVGNETADSTDPSGLWERAVHQDLSRSAANRALFKMRTDGGSGAWGALFSPPEDTSFAKGLEAGSSWPDFPGLDSTLYESHLGDDVFWHSMATKNPETGDFYSPQDMQKKMVDRIIDGYNDALNAKDDRTKGFEIGRSLHTLQDSFSPSHTVRGNCGTGPISQFQDYSQQDHGKHANDDVLHYANGDFPSTKSSYFAAQDASQQLLEHLKNGTDPDAVQKWLTSGPLALANGATVGGTLPRYAAPMPLSWDPDWYPMP